MKSVGRRILDVLGDGGDRLDGDRSTISVARVRSLLGEDSLDVREEGRGTARAKVGRRVAVVKFLSGRQRHKSGEEGEDLHSGRGFRWTN